MFSIFKKRTQDPKHFLVDNEEDIHFLDETEPEEQREEPKQKRPRKVSTPRLQTKQMIVDYLVPRSNEVTKHKSVADAIGAAEPYATTLLNELMATGTIKREGKRGSYKYHVVHKRVNKKRTSSTVSTPKPKKMTEVQKKTKKSSERVMAYISRNEDRPLILEDIARGSDITTNRASQIVRNLEKSKAIVRSLPTRDGTRYWLAGSVLTGPNSKDTTASTKLVAKTDDASLHALIEHLVSEYMRECKQTDILVFLEWLKKRK